MNSNQRLVLVVNGRRYERWEEIRVTREVDRMCTYFNIAVSERFLASAQITGSSPVSSFPPAPFQECTVAPGGASVLTGTIDSYPPEFARAHWAVDRLTSNAGGA
jgi:prophage tail gpP-like protein